MLLMAMKAWLQKVYAGDPRGCVDVLKVNSAALKASVGD